MAKDQKQSKSNPYSDTLNLPQTSFPMRAGLAKNEPIWVKRWLAEDTYGKMRAARDGAEKFIVHLGPPYANGNMHMGHALTYVLKDFVVRSKFMAGQDSPYVPGWDCHGLPIEWKVEQAMREEGKTKYDFSTKEIRDRCRAYANKWIAVQKEEWQRFGCVGDWENPYKTMDYANEAGIVRELGKLARRNLLYKGLRSTMWSTVEETALAEAEVEYADKTSDAIYVKFPIQGRENEFIIIWTTTPWTMPSNRAVAYAANENYVALKVEAAAEESLANVGETYWVAAQLQADFIRACGITEFATVAQQEGTAFEGWVCSHSFYNRPSPLLEGFHVTTDSGTGFVHIAPAHGQEDFQIGQEVGLELSCPVQGNGTYDETVAPLPNGTVLADVNIWKAQPLIIEGMKENGSLLHTYKYTHSYPVSWRSKAPLIFRATSQWFVALDKKIPELDGKSVRERALEVIHGTANEDEKVNWVPNYGENRIGSMIANRADWCLSRQRAWGVPITVIRVQKSEIRHVIENEIVVDPLVWEHIATLVEQEGVDAWDSRIEDGRQAELFPEGWLEQYGVKAEECEYVQDIMDVWMDSGTTHAHVIRQENEKLGKASRFWREDGQKSKNDRPADLYQEGSDQHRGWFHSSLLTSVANYNDAPYENVVTSGFVVDGEGRKFSKSLGNGVEPRQLLDTYGMDIIRLWVASSDYSEDIRYSDEIIKNNADAYRRFRNTFRFLLGNLSDFSKEDAIFVNDLPALESYMVTRLGTVMQIVEEHYANFKFHLGYRALYDFCNTELSNFYFDVRKDSLYCDGKNSQRRRACQTVLWMILDHLTTHLAPLMPFTTDEVWRSRYGDAESVHVQTYPEIHEHWLRDDPEMEQIQALIALREQVNIQREKLRGENTIGHDYEATALVTVPEDVDVKMIEEICLLSNVTVQKGEEWTVAVSKAKGHKCPRCWTYHEELTDGVCPRCAEAMKTDGHEVKAA